MFVFAQFLFTFHCLLKCVTTIDHIRQLCIIFLSALEDTECENSGTAGEKRLNIISFFCTTLKSSVFSFSFRKETEACQESLTEED